MDRTYVGRNKQAANNNQGFARPGRVLGMLDVQDKVAHRGEDHEEHEHEEGTGYKRLATTEVLDNIQTAESRAEIDRAENDLGDKAIFEPGTLEDNSSVVEEVVGSGKLLQGLQDHA